MSYLALFAAIPSKPKWNQQKVQSIKTEFFNRPNVKTFLKHLTFLLNHIPYDETDTYILELREAGEKIGLRLRQSNAEGVIGGIDSTDTDDDMSINSLGDRSNITTGMNSVGSGKSSYSSHTTRSSYNEAKTLPYWNEPLAADDPQLRTIMHEIALKSSVSANIFLVEQKRDRLIHAYVALCGQVKRGVISSKLDDPDTTDSLKFSDLKGLFEINYFHSSTFNDIIYPHRRRLQQQLEEERAAAAHLSSPASTSSLSPLRRRKDHRDGEKGRLPNSKSLDHISMKGTASPSSSLRSQQKNIFRESATLYFS